MQKTIIGVMPRVFLVDDKLRFYISDLVRKIIIENDCYPYFIIPPQNVDYIKSGKDIGLMDSEAKKFLYEQLDMCDGLLMPGGNRQFEFDSLAYNFALEKDIPVLGICMGMQVMCNSDNSTLEHKDTPIKNDSSINHFMPDIKEVHKVMINKNSKLYNILNKEEIMVNSIHNYHIEKVKNLKVSATSIDGYIEAVEIPNKKFVIGVQWHPELASDELNYKLILEFINAAKKFKIENMQEVKIN